MIKIQSISDIITNSSSEVFVVTTNKHAEVADFLKNVCDVFGIDMDDVMWFESATHSGIDPDWGFKVKKGDLVIHSAGDNSIPTSIMHIIEELRWESYLPNVEPLNVTNVNRCHLG